MIDKALTAEQQAQVRAVCMDMWAAYLSLAKEKLSHAQVVHDKFHLIKYLNEAIDKVRRREVKKESELKHSRYILLKNEENLTEHQRVKFEAIKAANYEVSRAWMVRENFKSIFKNGSQKESGRIFQQWHESVKTTGIKEVIKVAEMFKSHLSGVLNAMTTTITNAMAERLNGKIQLLKTVAREYRKFENFRTAILFFYGKLDMLPFKYR